MTIKSDISGIALTSDRSEARDDFHHLCGPGCGHSDPLSSVAVAEMVDLSAFDGLGGDNQAGDPSWSTLKTDDTHQCGSGCGHTSPLAGISLAEGFDLSAFNVITSRTDSAHHSGQINTPQENRTHQQSHPEAPQRENRPDPKSTFGNENTLVRKSEAAISSTRPPPQTRAASPDVRPGNIPYSRTEGASQRRESIHRTDSQDERLTRASSPLPPARSAERTNSSPVATLSNQGRPYVTNDPVRRSVVSDTQATTSKRQPERAPSQTNSSTRRQDEPRSQPQSLRVPPPLSSNQIYQSSGDRRTALQTSPERTTLQAKNSSVDSKSRGYVGWSSERPSAPQPHVTRSRETPSAQRLETAALRMALGVKSSHPNQSQNIPPSPASTRSLAATPRDMASLLSKPSMQRPLPPGPTPPATTKAQLPPRAAPPMSKGGRNLIEKRQSGYDQRSLGLTRKAGTTILPVTKQGAVQPERPKPRGETAQTTEGPSRLRLNRELVRGPHLSGEISKATTRLARATSQSTKTRESALERATSRSPLSRRLDIQRRAIIDRVTRVVSRASTSSKRQSVATRLAQIDLASRILELLNDEDDLTLYGERGGRRVRYPIRGARNRRRKYLPRVSDTERAQREKRRREHRGEPQRTGIEISGSQRPVAHTSHQAKQRVSSAKKTGPSKSLDIFQAKSDDDGDESALERDLAEPFESSLNQTSYDGENV